jgi:hypothetical protein
VRVFIFVLAAICTKIMHIIYIICIIFVYIFRLYIYIYVLQRAIWPGRRVGCNCSGHVFKSDKVEMENVTDRHYFPIKLPASVGKRKKRLFSTELIGTRGKQIAA